MSPERAPRPLVQLLHLAGLWNIAFAQPVFDVLARSPEFFVAHDARAINVWAFVVFISVAMPLALWGAVRGLSRLAPAAGRFSMAASCGGLLLLIVLLIVLLFLLIKKETGKANDYLYVLAKTKHLPE